jgi:hypothetical protein
VHTARRDTRRRYEEWLGGWTGGLGETEIAAAKKGTVLSPPPATTHQAARLPATCLLPATCYLPSGAEPWGADMVAWHGMACCQGRRRGGMPQGKRLGRWVKEGRRSGLLQAMHNYNIRSFSGCAQVVRLAGVDVVMQRRTLEDGCVGSFH